MNKQSTPKQFIGIGSIALLFLLLIGVGIINAQSGDTTTYLPIAVTEGDPEPTPTTPSGGDGAERIEAAGEFELEPESALAPTGEESEPVTEVIEKTDSTTTITCTTQEWGGSEVRDLTGRLALGTDIGIIYPGALIQGNSYHNGTFTEITIPRTGGTLTMEGVTLLPGSSYSRDVAVMEPDDVQNAIKRILETYDPEGATAAAYGDDFQQIYSYEHLLFTLGIDGRYGVGNSEFTMEADLSIDTEKETNYVFYRFQQKLYDVVYTSPESSTSVFRDGQNFVEPDPGSPQIGPGNPPLYVRKVSYGRIVYFVAESQFSSKDIEATLKAAMSSATVDGTVDSGLTYEQVMEQTRITTYVMGGNAGDAVQNIKEGSAADRFVAISEFAGSYENANFSNDNPVVPISYELRYLKDRSLAQMSYTTSFDKKDCETTVQIHEPTPPDRQMWARFTSVDDIATLYYVQGAQEFKVHSFKCVEDDEEPDENYCHDGHFIPIHDTLTGFGRDLDDTAVFKLELNTGAGDGSVELNYYSDSTGNKVGTKSWFCEASIINNCPGTKTWYYDVNVNDGTWRNQ